MEPRPELRTSYALVLMRTHHQRRGAGRRHGAGAPPPGAGPGAWKTRPIGGRKRFILRTRPFFRERNQSPPRGGDRDLSFWLRLQSRLQQQQQGWVSLLLPSWLLELELERPSSARNQRAPLEQWSFGDALRLHTNRVSAAATRHFSSATFQLLTHG